MNYFHNQASSSVSIIKALSRRDQIAQSRNSLTIAHSTKEKSKRTEFKFRLFRVSKCSEIAVSGRVSATVKRSRRWTQFCWSRVSVVQCSMRRGRSSGARPEFGSGFYSLNWSSRGRSGLATIPKQVCVW